MVFRGNSQNTLTIKPNRVQTYINDYGDTMVVISYLDAKTLLEDVLNYQYSDSLLLEYQKRDSLQNHKIQLKLELIKNLTTEKINLETMVGKLEKVNKNNLTIIDEQKVEIKKQKRFKFLGITGSIVLPILTLILKK